MTPALLPYSFFFGLLWNQGVSAYIALPRWGQAAALINDALFIHGGKTDQFNSYSYSSAPTNNDLLYLPLSSPFDPTAPPWQLISSSSISSTSQGPAVAWHTLSAFNTSQLLLFGGEPGPNSPTVLPDQPNSAELLDVSDPSNPSWIPQSASWANEPPRRMFHSASSSGGKIWLIGGVKTDGSNNALSDHYVFDPNTPAFTQLPTSNGPPDLYGHTSVVCNGKLLVFGGYSQSMSTLIPFSTIWSMDTSQPSVSWTTLDVSNTNLPTPRRAFAATVISGGKIVIHGGADAVLQTTYSDGWILDTAATPMTWTAVTALSQLGPRIDHFAMAIGSSIIFGFGYNSNSPVPAALDVFDASQDTFLSTFTPPPTSSVINTLPPTTHTSNAGSGKPGSGSATSSDIRPSNTGPPSGGSRPSEGEQTNHSAAIALSSVFGFLGIAAGAIVVIIYHRRRHPRSFHQLGGTSGGSGDDESRYHEIPTAQGSYGGIQSGWFPPLKNGALQKFGLGVAGAFGGPVRSQRQRRDMLADEDTREFGAGSVYKWRDGSGGSSWSLLSVFGNGPGRRSNEPSTHSSEPWREKSDPFSDSAALMMQDEAPISPQRAKLSQYRQPSYASTVGRSYTDPFLDSPAEETLFDVHEDAREVEDANVESAYAEPPKGMVTSPDTALHTLSPLAKQISRTSDITASASSHGIGLTSFDTSRATSRTSNNEHNSSSPRLHTSIVDTSHPPGQLIQRSGTWWGRFSKTSFLDRRSSDAGKSRSKVLDFRDPNPPPRLIAIREASMDSRSPGYPMTSTSIKDSNVRGRDFQQTMYPTAAHRRSITSLETSKTADSDVIERLGRMDVVRMGTADSQYTTHSSDRSSPTPDSPPPLSLPGNMTMSGDDTTVESPTEMMETDLPTPRSDQPPSSFMGPKSGGGVASRVRAYERRMSQEMESTSSPGSPKSPGMHNTRRWEERPAKKNVVSVNYGLAPRPPLFVANPDQSFRESSSET